MTQSPTTSDTPLTDAKVFPAYENDDALNNDEPTLVVESDFARKLERHRDGLAEALKYARRFLKDSADKAYVDAALASLEEKE